MIVDGHEDLALDVLADGRDYLTSAREIRELEAEAGLGSANGLCMLGYEDWRAADVRVIVATIQAIPREHAQPGEPTYVTIEAAYRQARAQLEIYRDWDAHDERLKIVASRPQLDELLADGEAPIGLVLLMENADSIRDVSSRAARDTLRSAPIFDGGQGAEAAPAELDTIADLPKLADALERRGYSSDEIDGIMSGNWLRVLERALPSV